MTTLFEEAPESQGIESCLEEIETLLSKTNLSVAELITLYANLGYKIGRNIAIQFYDRKLPEQPNIDELQKLYYTDPTIDISLILNSLNMLTWIQALEKKE